jgi:hypothetical protein
MTGTSIAPTSTSESITLAATRRQNPAYCGGPGVAGDGGADKTAAAAAAPLTTGFPQLIQAWLPSSTEIPHFAQNIHDSLRPSGIESWLHDRRTCAGAAPARASLSMHALAVAALLLGVVPLATAADWPIFKAGIWTFERTLRGLGPGTDKVSRTECADPTVDQKAQQEILAKAGCQFTPLAQSGRTYSFSATCTVGGVTTQSESVLEVESDEAYTITIDSVMDGGRSHEVLRARRVGDCPG